MTVLFSTKLHLFHNFIVSRSSNTFFINHTLKFKYQSGSLKVELCHDCKDQRRQMKWFFPPLEAEVPPPHTRTVILAFIDTRGILVMLVQSPVACFSYLPCPSFSSTYHSTFIWCTLYRPCGYVMYLFTIFVIFVTHILYSVCRYNA